MSKNSGYLVETKTGKQGRTYHCEGLLKGKMIVHLEAEKENNKNINYLCDPQTVKIIGYID